MDVLPPPEFPPISPSGYPQIPTRTPSAILEKLRVLCVNGDMQGFVKTLDSLRPNPRSEDFDICDFYGVMIEAIKRDDAQFIKELFHRGLPMDPLYAFEALEAKSKSALEIFIQYGWDINQSMSELCPSVLGNAIENEEMTAWLLDHGADPNNGCAIDLTPLSCAVKSAPISVINLMLSRGGDVQKGQVLHHAIERRSETIEVLKVLIENGAPINATMYQDHYPSWRLFYFMGLGTALHKAAELGKVDVVRYLISEGADLSIKDANGRTAMECAQIRGQSEVMKVFVN
ncbi:Ankyrin repeat protein [Penicillium sp. IBT 16267x]|nr:Ankyrin repeat protein [Penicillium sp. IBT 16267x]